MTHDTQLPAALASIKRETIDKACIAYNDQSMQFNDAQYVCMRAAIEAVLSDILPPPADGAVTRQPDEYQFLIPSTGSWCNTSKEAYETMKRKGGYIVRALYTAPPADSAIANCSQVTQILIRQLIERDQHGRAKYGTTLDRDDLTQEQWLQHMIEELLDAAGYAESCKRAHAPLAGRT